MENRCFIIRPIDEHREYVLSIKNSNVDNAVHKHADKILKFIDDSKGTLSELGKTLCNFYAMSQNLKQKEGKVNDLVYSFIVEILENLWQEGAADYSKCYDAFLANFSKEIDSKRPDSVEAIVKSLYGGDESREDETAEILLQNLDEINRLVEERNQLIGEYGELIAFLIRSLSTKGEYDQFRQLNEDLPLIKFIRDCARDRALELAEQMLRAQAPAEDVPSEEPSECVAAPESVLPEEVPEVPPATDSAPEITASSIPETSPETDAPKEPSEMTEVPESAETPPPSQELPQQESAPSESAQPEAPQATSAPLAPEEGGNRADVLFVLDASGSMRPCFDQLRTHIKRFVEPFKTTGFTSLRLGLLAYSANKNRTLHKVVYRNMFLCPDRIGNMPALYGDHKTASQMFFTNSSNIEENVDKFVRRLDEIKCLGDEDTPFAIDCAADFPFEPINTTRRVIILFTDEKIDDGVSKMDSVGENFSTLERIMEKISQRHISFYYFGPQSAATEAMEEYPRVFVQDVIAYQDRHNDTETWDNLDMGRILENIGKSVSQSVLQFSEEPPTERAIYGQDTWPENSWN